MFCILKSHCNVFSSHSTSIATIMPHLTPTSTIAAPYNPVAMHPSIASTLMYPSIATPVQMVTATPPYIATPIYSLSPASTPLLSTPPCCNTFNQLQPSQEFCPLGPELDMMLQSGSMNMFLQQWQVSSTPQWNFNGLESNPFVTAGLTTFNMATHPNYLAMATHSGVGYHHFLLLDLHSQGTISHHCLLPLQLTTTL